jgi:chromosome segregation ATPase
LVEKLKEAKTKQNELELANFEIEGQSKDLQEEVVRLEADDQAFGSIFAGHVQKSAHLQDQVDSLRRQLRETQEENEDLKKELAKSAPTNNDDEDLTDSDLTNNSDFDEAEELSDSDDAASETQLDNRIEVVTDNL